MTKIALALGGMLLVLIIVMASQRPQGLDSILDQIPGDQRPDSYASAVLVEFWAPWCGPCKVFTPILDSVTAEFQPQLSVVKLNIDVSQGAARAAGVTGIPAVLLFRDGKLEKKLVGVQSPDGLRAEIRKLLP